MRLTFVWLKLPMICKLHRRVQFRLHGNTEIPALVKFLEYMYKVSHNSLLETSVRCSNHPLLNGETYLVVIAPKYDWKIFLVDYHYYWILLIDLRLMETKIELLIMRRIH